MPDNEFQDVHDALGIAPTDPEHPSFWSKLGQTWPAKLVQSALSAAQLPGDVYAGRTAPLSDEAIARSADLAGFMTGTPGGVGGLGSGVRGLSAKQASDLSPDALKAIYEGAWKKGAAPFSTLADHVEKVAGSEKTPFNFIHGDTLDTWKDELGKKYGDWATLEREGAGSEKPSLPSGYSIEKPPKGSFHSDYNYQLAAPGGDIIAAADTEDELMKSAMVHAQYGDKTGDALHEALTKVSSQPSISEEALNKALAKNPGASIFDVSGVHVGGPSEKYTPTMGSNAPTNPLTYPREMPFDVPEHARPLGFTTPALHATPGESWVGPKDQLRLPKDQLGVHFGNPRQASIFSTRGGNLTDWKEQRTYPVVLQMQNPLELKDLGNWHADRVVSALHQINEGTHISYDKDLSQPVGYQNYSGRAVSPEAKGQFPASELDELKNIGDVRDYLASKGYDSVKYINGVEDQGHPSYILFNESPIEKGAIIGARSPFAQFDPKKLHLPSLAAGMGALSLYPFRGDEERKP